MTLKDSFNRDINYVRIAVTDRCNLRCFYCMPEQGIVYEPKVHLLSYEEIIRLLTILGQLGFTKVRFTGGEPFLRNDFTQLIEKTAALNSFESIHITSNGTLIQNHIPLLKKLGITKLNLSLDTLNEERFKKITRRNDFSKVWETLHLLINENFRIKVNTVVMSGINTEDILPMAELALKYPIHIRFIEEMPFNGGAKENHKIFSSKEIFSILKEQYPDLKVLSGKHGDTATEYTAVHFKGKIGIIPAFSRTFCTTCNRLRITANGEIKTCLYDGGVFSMRDFLRSGATDLEVKEKFIELVRLKPKDGFEAEKFTTKSIIRKESMSSIGG
ncbi:MAG: GTP 3',8-cyclase MoaA [Flavobacteriaceae bacterium]